MVISDNRYGVNYNCTRIGRIMKKMNKANNNDKEKKVANG